MLFDVFCKPVSIFISVHEFIRSFDVSRMFSCSYSNNAVYNRCDSCSYEAYSLVRDSN